LSDLLSLRVPLQPPRSPGRRASVLAVDRQVLVPSLPDLGQPTLPDPYPSATAEVLPGAVDHGEGLGFLAGHADGLAAGRAEAQAEVEVERAALVHARLAAEQLVSSLSAAVEEARRQRALALDGLSSELAEAALILAAAVIGREPGTGAEALARALALVAPSAAGVARLHPDDLIGLDVGPHAGITLQADPSIERGGCVLDLPDASIDAQLGPALERARDALLGQTEAAW
jgi:flagellar assembly protein FliH